MTDFDTKGAGPGAFWDDLRAPATAINPPGAESDPDLEATSGCWLFDAAATELIFVAMQMPHGWVEGSALSPHVHWTKTTSADGNVLWRMRYRYANAGKVLTAWSTAVSVATTITATADNDTADEHLLTSFGDITISGGRISMLLLFEIARIGGDDLDTYAADARLLEFDVHYKLNQPGSVSEYTKYTSQLQQQS